MNYSVEYYKEKDTDPMVFLQRFRCTTEPIGGGTEQDEEGELVSWEAAVAAIEIAMKQFGWHPASELPPIETDIVVWCILDDGQIHVGLTSLSEKKWPDALEKYLKRWCYPPKEE